MSVVKVVDIKFVLIIGITLFFYQVSFAQKDSVYFMFDQTSKETFIKEDGKGNKIKELLYRTNRLNDNEIVFYIKSIMFLHNGLEMENKRLISGNNSNSIDFLSSEEVVKYIEKLQKKYPFGPEYSSEKYPKMFIANVNKSKSITLYQVKWQYYIE
ncbi:hypothetical protein [Sinomicrobium soli]|uniref:hypothetical protein n=1 Tax=Sinomicrobium sp. N-1-3-6 TaxID=2219864 RepID=UPI000DCD6D07|nr:hypothetical protein [Sinomicrobium sp. N-1-3-6]RAV27397.1 hypothetical protein DN748_18850 [Sinomicrobium sp. N-1-3-6]